MAPYPLRAAAVSRRPAATASVRALRPKVFVAFAFAPTASKWETLAAFPAFAAAAKRVLLCSPWANPEIVCPTRALARNLGVRPERRLAFPGKPALPRDVAAVSRGVRGGNSGLEAAAPEPAAAAVLPPSPPRCLRRVFRLRLVLLDCLIPLEERDKKSVFRSRNHKEQVKAPHSS